MAASLSTRRLVLILSLFVLYALHRQSRLLHSYLKHFAHIERSQEIAWINAPPSRVYPSPLVVTKTSRNRKVSLRHDNSSKGESSAEVSLWHGNSSKGKSNREEVVSSVSVSSGPVRQWAYAFLIGGCSSKTPEYRGFLYNVIVAAKRLRELGSKADVVVFLQMSTLTDETKLPDHESKVLDAMGIRTHYLPKVAATVHEVFYALVMEKFRTLELTEYSRVLFLDGDIMPLCSMDYIFELSEPKFGEPVLKENVVLSWRQEAANAGFFMLRPDKKDYLELKDVIRKREEKALELPWPYWNEVEGWGHKIEAPDFWRSPDRVTGTNWTWHAVFADQGLLYHWTKYVKQSVSLIISDEVENWTSRNGTAHLERTMTGILNNYTCRPPLRGNRFSPAAPYRDFRHFTGTCFLVNLTELVFHIRLIFCFLYSFTGKSKPWQQNRSKLYFSDIELLPILDLNGQQLQSVLVWYHTLKVVGKETNTTFDFSFDKGRDDSAPPVGRFSDYAHMIKHIQAKALTNWTHYEK
jgi:hypothetical protein